MRWDLEGCWWEKLWERPRLCLSSSSRTAGLDGLLLGDRDRLRGRASAGALDMDAVNCSFSFMC